MTYKEKKLPSGTEITFQMTDSLAFNTFNDLPIHKTKEKKK